MSEENQKHSILLQQVIDLEKEKKELLEKLHEAKGRIDQLNEDRKELVESIDKLHKRLQSESMRNSKWRIWSIEHNAWWRWGRNGYTRNKLEAGQYTLDEAFEIVEEANLFLNYNDPPNEALILVLDRLASPPYPEQPYPQGDQAKKEIKPDAEVEPGKGESNSESEG